MKAVILLVCLTLVQISWGEADHEVSSSDGREVFDRYVREGEGMKLKKKKRMKKTRKGKKKNGKGKGNRRNKARRNGKSPGKGRKNGNKKSKNSKPRKNGKGSKKGEKKSKINKKGRKNGKNSNLNNPKPAPAAESRQTDTECFKTLCEKSKKFNLYQTQLRKAKRVESWVEQMDKKKAKAPTTFQNASDAIQASTSNGTQCESGAIGDEAKTANEKLQKCKSTAVEKCSSSKIEGLDTAKITECKPKLQAYVDAYKECLKKCECSCFTGLALVDDSCTKFSDMETKTKTAKNKCTKQSEDGSFGDCRKQERVVAHYGNKCKACTKQMSTKVGFHG